MPVQTIQQKSQIYRYNNGGLNIRQSITDVADNEATEAINTVFFENGTIKIRPPWKVYGTVAVPISANNFLTGVYGLSFPAGNTCVFATDSSKIYGQISGATSWTDVTGATGWTRPTVTQTAGNLIVNFVYMGGYLIGYDGVNNPWKHDGTATLGVLSNATPLNTAPGGGYVNAPIGYGAIVFQNRLFWCGVSGSPSRIFYSELNDPTLYKATSYIDIPSQTDTDQIQGFGILFGSLLVFKRNSIYVIQGTDPTNFVVTKMNSAVGAISPSAITSVDNLVYFMSDRGLHAANMFNVLFMTPKIEPIYQSSESVSSQNPNTIVSYSMVNCKFLSSVFVTLSQGRGRITRATGLNIRDTLVAHDYFNMDQNGYPSASKFILGSSSNSGPNPGLPAPYCMSEVTAPIFNYPTVLASFGDNFVYYLNRDAWLAGTGADDYSLSGTQPVSYVVNDSNNVSYLIGVTDGGAVTATVTTPTVSPAAIYLQDSGSVVWQLGITTGGALTLTVVAGQTGATVDLLSSGNFIYQLGASTGGAITTTLVAYGSIPIEMTYTTKSFDFGDPNALKFLRWFWSEGLQPTTGTLTLYYSNNPSQSESSNSTSLIVGSRTRLPTHSASKFFRVQFYTLGGAVSNFGLYLSQFSFDVLMKGRRA